MSLLEQQNLLAKVYTDPAFRASFYADPFAVGRSHGLREDEVNELMLAAPAEVEFFSESLLWKRFHEVEKTLPVLKTVMGDNFSHSFFDFARSYNPTAIRKHYEDALEFCSHVIDRGDEFDAQVCDAARYERARLRFFNEGRILECYWNRYSYSGAAPPVEPRFSILGFSIWLRLRKRVLHFRL